ncbi:MAG: hypothetical protein H6Q99_3039 [Proteobacteria bacterium]|nr:hypothetical protein [Pseudomonadota bacterium]
MANGRIVRANKEIPVIDKAEISADAAATLATIDV